MTNLVVKAALVGAIMGAGVAARADREGPRRPPQEAFDACASKAAGDACQVTFGERVITGSCTSTPEEKLACRPDHVPPPPEGQEHGAPPPS